MTGSTVARRAGNGGGNGATPKQSGAAAPTLEAKAGATEYEAQIAEEAAAIRDDAETLTPALFVKLWPLLRKPIPEGFIVTTGVVTGKPYPSTGVKSVQVLTDRMDAVLTPLWWWDEVKYIGEGNGPSDAGKLARVTVYVGTPDNRVRRVLIRRVSYGGVDRASTLGNLYKGSYTNAAKRAFAAIGPGHEVYLGTTDLDPDVSEDAAKAQAKPARESTQPHRQPGGLPEDEVQEIAGMARQLVDGEVLTPEKLKAHLVGAGAATTTSSVLALRSLTPEQGDQFKSTLADLLAASEETTV